MSIPSADYDEILDQCRRIATQGRTLRPGDAPIAAFDADGTLWDTDVAEVLWQHLVDRRALHPRAAGPIARTLRASGEDPSHDPYDDYGRLIARYREERVREDAMVRVMIEGLAGLEEARLYDHAREAFSSCEALASSGRGRPADMVRRLRAEGYRVVVVSSSPRWAVEVAVEPLGVPPHDVIGGDLAVVDGRLAGSVIQPLPHAQGKVEAVLRRFGAVPRVSAGNTIHDLALLAAASHVKLLVNPTDDLIAAFEERGAGGWSASRLDLHTDARPRTKIRKKAAAIPMNAPSTRAPRQRLDS